MDGPQLPDFAGRWRIGRRIEDRAGGNAARFDGQGVFTPDGGGLDYAETGILHSGGRRLTATRSDLWRPDPGGIAVLFADGRPFHVIGPGPVPDAVHDCPPDLYRVRYDFSVWPVWTATWQVTGPRKDYILRSRYAPDR